jgi:predicted Zn-dependent protease
MARIFLFLKFFAAFFACAFVSVPLRADAKSDDGKSETAKSGVLYSDKNKVPPGATEKETKLGDKTAEELEKNPKVKILDPKKDAASQALYDKLNKMAQTIGKNSARPKIDYKVKVIEDTDVNAFTLPNGNIYFYTGLLDILGSDDEIAAVMAHEIGHNAEMHALRGASKAGKISLIGMGVMLAALMGGGKGGTDVALFSQYLLTGIISGYSVEFEKEADASAISTMQKSGYNPSAIVTVMQRFEVEEKRHPKSDPGIFRTHPPSQERADSAEKNILAAGLPFNPRAVSGGASAAAVESDDRVKVEFKNVTLMQFAAGSTPGGLQDAKARANRAAFALNELLKENVQLYEIKIERDTDKEVRLIARGREIARVLPADAALQNLSLLECAQKWRLNLRQIFWRETINGAM